MTETAYFIHDRALALRSDAKIHPATAPAAIRYLELAQRWANAKGESDLLPVIIGVKYAISERAQRHSHVPA